jgi:branched-chain amino acid transport system substrate-binding protein
MNRSTRRMFAVTIIAPLIAFGSLLGSTLPADASTSKPPITIGLDSVLSGALTTLAALPNGSQAYFNYVNAHGGVNGHKIETKAVDTGYLGPQTVAVTQQLQNADNADGVIGIGTVPMTALHAVKTQFHIPIFMAADGSLFTPSDKYFFDVSPDFYRMWALASSVVKTQLHAKSVSYVYENDSVGTPVVDGGEAWAKQHGLKVAASVAVEKTADDCSPQASILKSADAPVVIFGANGPPAACVIKASTAIGYTPTWFTNYGGKDPGLTSLLTNSQIHKIDFLDYGLPLTDTKAPAVSIYLKNIEKYYPKSATALTNIQGNEYVQQGWEIGAVMVDAIKLATANGKAFTVAGLTKALNDDFKGQAVSMLPSVTYNATQHYSTTKMDVNGYDANGKVKVLSGFITMPASPVAGK